MFPVLSALYNRPQDNLCPSDLDIILEALISKTNEIIWCGDFNARHPNWGTLIPKVEF